MLAQLSRARLRFLSRLPSIREPTVGEWETCKSVCDPGQRRPEGHSLHG